MNDTPDTPDATGFKNATGFERLMANAALEFDVKSITLSPQQHVQVMVAATLLRLTVEDLAVEGLAGHAEVLDRAAKMLAAAFVAAEDSAEIFPAPDDDEDAAKGDE